MTQSNKQLIVGLGLAANTQVSSLSAIFTTALLSSPKLPSLLDTNAKRLGEAYDTVVSFFRKHGVEYMPVSHGPFVFARIAPGAVSWEDEARAIACCKDSGVVLSRGGAYHIVEHEKGWARLTFAIRRDRLDEALLRLETGLAKIRSISKFNER